MRSLTRVAVVEDDATIREALELMLDADPDFACAGAYGSAEHALRSLGGFPADILLLDIHLPGMMGSDAALRFHERFPRMAIVMFTVFEDDRRIFTSLVNGACGYILKKTPPEKILGALRDVRDGGSPISPEIAKRVVDLFRRMRPRELVDVSLTSTEVKLLQSLAEGHSYQSAAETMKISINTVRDHVRSIYDKLHVHSKSEAVSKALRAGLI